LGLQCFYDGKQIQPWSPSQAGQAGGSRNFWNIKNKWFVKAQMNYDGWSQTRNEVKKRLDIDPEDDSFFTKMLAYADMDTDKIAWSVWEYVDLNIFHFQTRKHELLYSECQRKVEYLCDKYNIGDMGHFVNGNWFIHNDQPLIVDLGCDG
jgi:hypothetical protein